MRLFEMASRPTEAGLAKLRFSSMEGGGRSLPLRERADIFLPDDPDLEFFPIKGGAQFLLSRRGGRGGYWFGGTDENPFLVELQAKLFLSFVTCGEEGFYADLKPQVVTRLEQELRVSARRQGDIFAVPVPLSLETLRQASIILSREELQLESVESLHVFGTRHELTGLSYDLDVGSILGEGVLRAPDHSPLELKGVHLIAQAEGLLHPERAD